MPPQAGGTPHDPQRCEAERHHGARDGEAFDQLLREHERLERDERMSRIVWTASGGSQEGSGAGGQPSLGTLQLKDELERMSAYYNAVQKSRAWRLTQRLRRLVGRAW